MDTGSWRGREDRRSGENRPSTLTLPPSSSSSSFSSSSSSSAAAAQRWRRGGRGGGGGGGGGSSGGSRSRAPRSRGCRGGGGGGGGAPRARINIKETLLREYLDVRNEREFFDRLRALHGEYGIPLAQLQTHALHIFAEKDDIRMTERLLKQVSDANREEMANSTQGQHEYTPLCRALYSGSISLVKVLVAAGGDVNFSNGHGEGLEAALEVGRAAAIERLPESKLFIEARFTECLKFIEERREWLLRQAEREPTAEPWKPAHLRRREADVAGAASLLRI